MRLAAVIMFVVSLGTGAFAWWGLFTASGRRSYEEMAGIVPAASGVVSAIAFIGAVITLVWSLYRR